MAFSVGAMERSTSHHRILYAFPFQFLLVTIQTKTIRNTEVVHTSHVRRYLSCTPHSCTARQAALHIAATPRLSLASALRITFRLFTRSPDINTLLTVVFRLRLSAAPWRKSLAPSPAGLASSRCRCSCWRARRSSKASTTQARMLRKQSLGFASIWRRCLWRFDSLSRPPERHVWQRATRSLHLGLPTGCGQDRGCGRKGRSAHV